MADHGLDNRICRRGIGVRTALLLTASVFAGAVAATPVAAQQAPAPAPIDVPSGPLDAGLRALSEQAGVQLIYSSDLVAGKVTPGASGRVSVEQGVAQLLRGTGLTFRVVNGRTIQIELPLPGEAGERVLGAVRVEGTQGDGYVPATRGDGIAQLGGVRGRQDQEVDGYRPRVATVGTGTPEAIEDAPRSITVLTPELIEKEDVVTLDDALRRLPGVTVQERANIGSTGNAATIYVRGQRVQDYQIDGDTPRSLTNFGNATLNLDAFDRVELIRGPNALFVGEGSAGGSLNLIRKRPGAVPAASITIEGGTLDRIDVLADISTPSVLGSAISFRGVASVRRSNGYVDDYKTTDTLLYGIFDAPLGDTARLEFGGQYNVHDADGENNGQIRDISGALVDFGQRFNYSAGTGAYNKARSTELFAKLNVDLRKDWDFEFGGYYRTSASEFQSTTINLTLLPNSIPANRKPQFAGSFTVANQTPTDASELGISSKLTGKFDTFGLTHNVFASIGYSRTDSGQPGSTGRIMVATIATLNDIRNPVFTPSVRPTTAIYAGSYTASTGLVFGDTISWRDIVSVTGTLRRDIADNATFALLRDRFGVPQTFTLTTPFVSSNWRPSYSATIKPIKRLTLYGSYADGFTRQDDRFSRSGTAPNFTYAPLAPSTYRNFEGGIKYGADHWLVSVSAYDLRQQNASLQVVPALSACPSAIGGTNLVAPCYQEGGTNSKTRGVDVEFNGQIANGLSVVGSYNYSNSTYTGSTLPAYAFAPQSSANLFLDWHPHFLPGLGLQIGGRYQGRYDNTGTFLLVDDNGRSVIDPATGKQTIQPFEVEQNAYIVADLGIDYQFAKTLGMRLFIENLTDKTYFSTLSLGNGNFYGSPRRFMVSLIYRNAGKTPLDGRSPTTGRAPFGDPANWYAAFDAGYNIAGDLHATASGKAVDGTTPVAWTFETKNAPAFAVRLGYLLGDNVRGEIEGKYRKAEFGRIGGATVAPFGVCGEQGSTNGTPFNCADVPGKTDNWSMMANLLYDFGSRDAVLRPFVGGGFGVSRNSVNFQGKMDGIGGTGPFISAPVNGRSDPNNIRPTQESIGGVGTTTSITWQAIAGASLKLSDRLHLDATYRYVAVPNMTFSSYNLDEPALSGAIKPLTPRVGDFKADYNSHMLTLGLRWAFGSKAPR